jgi:FixJ family two-component response regulator
MRPVNWTFVQWAGSADLPILPAMAAVYLIDPDAQVRASVGQWLGAAGYEVRMYAAPGDYLVPEPETGAGVLLLRLRLRELSGIEFAAALEHHPSYRHPIIFLADEMDVSTSVRAMHAGAHDVLTKPLDGSQLLAAVDEAMAFDVRERELRALSQLVRGKIESLSSRERKVLGGIVAGTRCQRIAADLGVSERTVKGDRSAIMKQLGVRSIPGLFRLLFAARDVDRLLH